MAPQLPDGINQIVACDGKILISANDSILNNIDFCSGIFEVSSISSNGLEAITQSKSILSCTSDEITILPLVGEAPNLQINDLPEWTVPGGTTLTFRIDGARVGNKFEIFFKKEQQLGREAAGSKLVFIALVAAHRLQATLRVEFRDQNGNVLAGTEDRVTTEHLGGTDVSQHKSLRMEIDVPLKAETWSVIVLIDHIDDPLSAAPFLFISNPQLSLYNHGGGPCPYLVEGRSTGKIQIRGSVNPYIEAKPRIVVGSSILPFPERPAVQFSNALFKGRSLYIQASVRAIYTIYIDGQYTVDAYLGASDSSAPLPLRLLDGGIHHIAVRDQHGLYVLHEDYHILPAVLTPYEVLQRETRKPLPHQLANQAAFRYRALACALEQISTQEEAAQLAHAHHVVSSGFEALRQQDVTPLTFPRHDKPDVSIVIPVHGKFNITYFCLCALLLAYNRATFEVIVVDDGSTDETSNLANLVTGITVIRNETAQRFIRACNEGVTASRGEYIVLLNNDTEPTLGWLDELIEPFLRFEQVGLTGSKLLYPDGSLQEAGGIIWNSGNPWNYGRKANAWEPRFSYTRQADYLSGAAMMTKRALWDTVGGLSTYLEPMYFEDTDFAFKVREAGYTTYFAPLSVVYHYEGQTSGTEVTSGMKRFQEINRPKFKKRWATAYRTNGQEGAEVDLVKDRGIIGRVAFLDNSTPRPDRDAGSYAAIEEMKLVQSLGFKITFLPHNVAYLGCYTEELMRQGIETIIAPYYLSINEFIEARGAEFDVFYISRYQVASQYIDTIRRHAPRAKIMFMNADLHFLRELRAAVVAKDPGRVRDAALTRDDELATMRKADVTLSYNEVEHSVIVSHTLDAVKVVRAPWVVRAVETVPSLEGRQGLSFLGGYGHPPNVEAVEWFSSVIMPLLSQELPDEVFHIYGSAMGASVKALEAANVVAHGFVEDLADVYDRHRVFVAPLRSGAGIKGKVLGALARGIPCVLSPFAAEGIGLRNGYDCLIANEEVEWINAIKKLTQDDVLWKKLSDNALKFVLDEYSPERGRELMRKAFEAVDIWI